MASYSGLASTPKLMLGETLTGFSKLMVSPLAQLLSPVTTVISAGSPGQRDVTTVSDFPKQAL